MSEDVLAVRLEQVKKEAEHYQAQTALLLHLAQASAGAALSSSDVIGRLLETIVLNNNWVFGQYWTISENDNLARCSELFYSTAHLPDFRNASLDRQVSKGVDLPGRVWSTGYPVSVPDIAAESGLHFTRQDAALKSQLVSGIGFAIKNGPFTTGVFEFFDVGSIKLTQQDALFYEKVGLYISTLLTQKHSEAMSRQIEEEYREVLNHAYDAFISIDEASLILNWTNGARELFGWKKEEVVGKPLADTIIPERYRDAHMKGLFRYMTTKEGPVINKRVQVPALRKDGSEIQIELKIFPILTRTSRHFGAFISAFSDENRGADIVLK